MKELAPECFDAQDRLDTTCTKLLEIKSINVSDDELVDQNGSRNEDLFNEIFGEDDPQDITFTVNGLQYLTNLSDLIIGFGNTKVSAEKIHLPKNIASLDATGISFDYDNNYEFNIDIPQSVLSLSLSGFLEFYGGEISCKIPIGSKLESIDIIGLSNVDGIMNTQLKRIQADYNLFSDDYYGFEEIPNTVEEIHFLGFDKGFEENIILPETLPSIKKLSFNGFDFNENDNTFTISNYTTLEEISFINTKYVPVLNYLQSLKKITYSCDISANGGEACEVPNINLNFPEGLVSLNISNFPSMDPIQPILPQSIQDLTLSAINLSVLTNLPNSLKTLNISKNNFEILESFPSQLENLNVSGNTNLKCLPTLPSSLKTINFSATKITCIPNETDQLKSTISLPLCPNPCGETPDLLAGIVFLDLNKNRIFDKNIDKKIQGAFIHANDRIVTTNINGEYRVYADTDIENKLSVTYYHPHLDKILPAQRTYTNSGNSISVDTLNFAVQLKDAKDVEVLISPFRARNGFTPQVNITVTNRGTVPVNNLNLSLYAPLDWTIQNTSPTAQNISDSILWNNIGLDVGQSKNYIANLTVPASAIINTPFSISAKLHQITDDVSPENNTNIYSSVITGSFDPNDKQVTPETLAPNYAEGTELIYTVRFQNTGNDTAFNVVVLDTILEHLDPLTFRVIEKSHPLEWYLNENREVTFNFNNINLLDSNVNEVASHGYVTFAIQPLPNLASGTIFENRAAIYFDFNAPIMTNYAISKVNIITVINEKNALQLNVYPNPTKDILNIRWNDSGKTKLSISDISGKAIFQSVEIGNYKQIPTQNLSKGMYFIQIQNEQGLGISKIIVQ
jgi:hypothetical protein